MLTDRSPLTPIAKNFMFYCRLIYMLSILCVRLTIKVKVGIPESFKVGWYPLKKTGSSHLNTYLNKTANTFHDCGPSDTDLPILMRTQYGPSLLINDLKIKHVKPGWKWVKGISRSHQKQKRNKERNTDILIFQPNRPQFRFLGNCPPTPPLSQH